nr:50S ribosomal protein L18 [Vallitalea guaymasensis]
MKSMIKKTSRTKVRVKKHRRIRNNIIGTSERPRLVVFRSDKHMYAQVIDDLSGHTLAAASTVEKDIKSGLEKTNNVAAAVLVGETVAKRAVEKGVTEVIFDRGGYIYQGKVKALADSAREAGLKF